MADLKFIASFLNRKGVEGPRQLRGYVPCTLAGGGKCPNYRGQDDPARYKAINASGVTIATGVDLGQTDAATLSAYGLSDNIVKIYKPYLGLKRQLAIDFLFVRPLTIEAQAGLETDLAVHKGYLDRFVRPAFEKDSSLKFDSLPPEAQAAIFSICYQKGVGGTRKGCPNTWAFFCAGDWAGASRELQTGFTKFPERRRLEGKLLEALL